VSKEFVGRLGPSRGPYGMPYNLVSSYYRSGVSRQTEFYFCHLILARSNDAS
jgi:hypothetical protein